jgi:uncharacterized LabA/DUF88 family protein
MDKCIILVDNSNVFIEGQKLSAKKKGIKRQPGDTHEPCDPSWRIDFGSLLKETSEGNTILKAILVGSTPPSTDTIWQAARDGGFEVITHEKNTSGKEKAVDTEIVAKGTELVCTTTEPAILKLLSGDRDFIPLINIANGRKWETEMWAFESAFKQYGQMAQTVTRVKPLDPLFTKIGRNDFSWPTK